jgi:hypothetical protein
LADRDPGLIVMLAGTSNDMGSELESCTVTGSFVSTPRTIPSDRPSRNEIIVGDAIKSVSEV